MNDPLLDDAQEVEHDPVDNESTRPGIKPHHDGETNAHHQSDVLLMALASCWVHLLLNDHRQPVNKDKQSVSIGQAGREKLGKLGLERSGSYPQEVGVAEELWSSHNGRPNGNQDGHLYEKGKTARNGVYSPF